MTTQGWIGVDLDGTLAHYEGWADGVIGKPIAPMVERVLGWLAEGKQVRIMTARVSAPIPGVHRAIEDWCAEHLGVVLPITCIKDFHMVELWDDRVYRIVPNTGRTPDECEALAQKRP